MPLVAADRHRRQLLVAHPDAKRIAAAVQRRVQASGLPARLVSGALEQEGDFVAVVSRTDAFRDLIDRRALLQNLAAMETE